MLVLDVEKKRIITIDLEEVIRKDLAKYLSDFFSKSVASKYSNAISFDSISGFFIIYNEKFYRFFDSSLVEVGIDKFIPSNPSKEKLIDDFINSYDFKSKLIEKILDEKNNYYNVSNIRIRIVKNIFRYWKTSELNRWFDYILPKYISDKVKSKICDEVNKLFVTSQNVILKLIIENDFFELYIENEKLKLRKLENYKEKIELIVDEACNFSTIDEIYEVKTLLLNAIIYHKRYIEDFRILELRNGYEIGELKYKNLKHKFFYECGKWISFPIPLDVWRYWKRSIEKLAINLNNIDNISKALKEFNVQSCNLIDTIENIYSFDGEHLELVEDNCNEIEAKFTLAYLELTEKVNY